MIIGNGVISKSVKDHKDFVFFASGASNSSATNDKDFNREKILLKNILKKQNKPIIYFSTITVFQKNQTPYIKHKIEMEKLLNEKSNIIFRLPNILSFEGPIHQLVPNIMNQIRSGEVTIQKQARRYLIDEYHLSNTIEKVLQNKNKGFFELLPKSPILVEDIVDIICKILNKKIKKKYIEKKEYPLNYAWPNPIFVDVNYEHMIHKHLSKNYL